MPNRSISSLPVIFSDQGLSIPSSNRDDTAAVALDIFDATYLHFHPYMELGFCVSGTGTFYIDGREFSFKPQDVQITFPFQRHLNVSTSDTSKWYWPTLDPLRVMEDVGYLNVGNLGNILTKGMGLCGIIDREKYPHLYQTVRKLIESIIDTENKDPHMHEIQASLVFSMIMELYEISIPLPKLDLHVENRTQDIAPALERIHQGLNEGFLPSVQELSRLCNMSTTNFRLLFHQELRCSPREYLNLCRIHKAKRLLAFTERPITDIAAAVGYDNISGFNRCFLNTTGTTPSEFRKKTNKNKM
mgnify:FL=1